MLAAVIFFVFSIVVNMVLINMMMAIINMSFEEVKVDKHKFKSKFQLFEYIKRSARELYGSTYAKPIVVKYGKNDGLSSDDEASWLSISHDIVPDKPETLQSASIAQTLGFLDTFLPLRQFIPKLITSLSPKPTLHC